MLADVLREVSAHQKPNMRLLSYFLRKYGLKILLLDIEHLTQQ